jgi:HSP20 family molecular chaperone IbpA
MRRLSDDLDELFGQLVGGPATSRTGAVTAPLPFVADAPVDWMPAIEAFQRDGKLVVQADLPGLQIQNTSDDTVKSEGANGRRASATSSSES